VEQINGVELSWLRMAGHRKRQKLTPNYWPGVMSACSVAWRAIRQAGEQMDREVAYFSGQSWSQGILALIPCWVS